MSNSLAAPWTVVLQAPLSMGFPRYEYWSGLPFPSLGDFPNPGSNVHLLHGQVDSLPLSHQGSRMLLDMYKTFGLLWFLELFCYIFFKLRSNLYIIMYSLFKVYHFTFFFGCNGSLILCGLSLGTVSKSHSLVWYVGFSLWWLLLWSTGSKVPALQ